MKKLIRKLAAIVGVICLAITTGCGGTGNGTTSEKEDGGASVTLTVGVTNFGYGIKWLQDIGKAFSAVNSGVKIDIKPTVLPYSLVDQFDGGLKGYDIFFMVGGLNQSYSKGTFIALDDVFATTPDGESKTIAEKMESFMLDACVNKNDGHYYAMKWGDSYYGWVANKTTLDALFGKGQYELPRTTDELIDMLKDVRTTNRAYGHVMSTGESYMEACLQTWWSQYDFESYVNYFDGMYYNADGELVEAKNGESLEAPGKKEALTLCETLIKKSNGYVHQYSNSMSFSEAQAAFLGLGYGFVDTKPVAFMCNAGWLENETSNILADNSQDLVFTRIPVISKIINVVPDKTISDDGELSALVKAIDEGSAATQGNGYDVSQADFEYVRDARHRVVNNGIAHDAGILANSQNKELAKKFLTFFASDAAAQIYANSMGGLTLPYGYVPVMTSANSEFIKGVNSIKKDNLSLPSTDQRRLTSHGTNIALLYDYSGWNSALFAGTKTAAKLYQEDITTYKSQWAYLTGEAG